MPKRKKVDFGKRRNKIRDIFPKANLPIDENQIFYIRNNLLEHLKATVAKIDEHAQDFEGEHWEFETEMYFILNRIQRTTETLLAYQEALMQRAQKQFHEEQLEEIREQRKKKNKR